jgi:hypothetical protein
MVDRLRLSGENLQNGWKQQKGEGSFLVRIGNSWCLHCLTPTFLPVERLQGPQSVNLTRADQTKPGPRSGAVQLEWNKTGSLLLVRFGKQSQTLLF